MRRDIIGEHQCVHNGLVLVLTLLNETIVSLLEPESSPTKPYGKRGHEKKKTSSLLNVPLFFRAFFLVFNILISL